MRRQIIALAIGTASIALAAAVGAQVQDLQINAQQAEEQAKAAVDTMTGRLKDAQKDYAEAKSNTDAAKMNCISEPLKMLESTVKLAQSSLLELQGNVARKDKKGVITEYVKISTFLGKAEGYYGELKGCGGDSGSGSIDGRPLIEKQVSSEVPKTNATEGTQDLPSSSGYVSSASPFFSE